MRKINRKHLKRILVTLGCCCIIAAAALKMYNDWDSVRAGKEAERLNTMLVSMIEKNPQAEGMPADVDADLAVLDMGNYEVCGSIAIPAIRIELPVIAEWSYDNLHVSCCRFYGTPSTQMMIMAHNYDSHFGRINRLTIGDAVVFTDLEGRSYAYEVIGIEIWATDQLREIIAGDNWDLTLFTCTYGGENRVTVRCGRSQV